MAKNFKGESLYNLATNAVIRNFHKLRDGLDEFPETILFDIIHRIYLRNSNPRFRNERVKRKNMAMLTEELSHFPTFVKLLKVGDKRSCLHTMLQATVEKTSTPLPDTLAQAFCLDQEKLLAKLNSPSHNNLSVSNTSKTLELGFILGGFLCEAGWYPAASEVHRACVNILRSLNPAEVGYPLVKLECLTKLLHSLSNYCQFSEAGNIFTELTKYVQDQELTSSTYPNLAYIYSEFSSYHFMKSNYHEAFTWAMESVKILTLSLPPKLTLDVLRQASKACIVKREFVKAEILVKQALGISKTVYGDSHLKYADSLIDYGFYLLNVDCITASMQVYQQALKVRKACFGGDNLQVALAHEDLAYATYVNEYSSGKFSDAKWHAEKSLSIMGKYLSANHLFVASSKRVLALILEEIAIDTEDTQDKVLLTKSEELHLFALNLSRRNFGENNVQTAKHYGNLGRLYQTMDRFEAAEKMHLRAIEIKEEILGKEDYEVALSVGHLASLYNYDMKQHLKAEKLYLRSIKIGRKLFGPTYSGLEYDYRGLIQVYQRTNDYNKYLEYSNILQEWRISRDAREAEQIQTVEVAEDGSNLSISALIESVTATRNSDYF